jgi:DNA polymerase-1
MRISYEEDFAFFQRDCHMVEGLWVSEVLTGLDVETEGVLQPFDGEVATVQVAIGDTVYVVHWGTEYRLPEVSHVEDFVAYLTDESVCKVIHNATFELKFFLHNFGAQLCVNNVADTMAREYVLSEGSGFDGDVIKYGGRFGLDDIVLRRYAVTMDKDHELRTGFRRRGSLTLVPPAIAGGHPPCERCEAPAVAVLGSGKGHPACFDCWATPGEWKRLKKFTMLDPEQYTEKLLVQEALTDRQLEYAAADAWWVVQIYRDQELDAQNVNHPHADAIPRLMKLDSQMAEAIARMELHGVPLDLMATLELDMDYAARIAELDKQVLDALYLPGDEEKPLNIASQPQMLARMRDFGYDIPNYQGPELKRKRGIPVVDAIIEWKRLARLKTYTEGFMEAVHPKTGRIHPRINQFETVTGRLSCVKPNLQNVPSKGKEAKKIRALVAAPEGHSFVIADYSNIEMRLIAEMYHDDNMIRAFNQGLDVHTMLAAQLTGKTYAEMEALVEADDDWAKEKRAAAKPGNFGLGYGAGEPKLMEIAWRQYELDWSREYAKQVRDAYFNSWPGVGAYHERTAWDVKHGYGPYYAFTQSGRARRMPRTWTTKETPSQPSRKKSCVAAALNHPIQGSSADMIKEVMVELMRKTQLMLQIHDELILVAPDAQAEEAKVLLKTTMEMVGQRYLTKLPIKVDAKIAKVWTK